MKHLRYLLLAALVMMPLSACDDDNDGDGGGTAPVVGTVSGTVSVEGNGLAGVGVTLVGATSQSATTGSGGAFSFSNVEAGSYGVTIADLPSDVSFSTTSKTTSITTSGQTVTVDFSGSYIRTSSIQGQVLVDGAGIAGVAVTAAGPEGTTNAVTDNGGNYGFSGLRAGDYTVTIAPGADYTFATTAYDITLGTGEAKTASFFGEMVTTVDPVTANVVIKSVTTAAGVTINPNNVAGQINVTVQVDPGENDLQRVCILLDGMEIANGCQTLGSAVAEDLQMQAGVFEIVFTIFTNDINADTGAPVYLNDTYELSAVLDLENAQQSNVTTSMNLTFNNTDMITAMVTPEMQGVVGGDYVLGGVQTVMVYASIFSGKTLDDVNVSLPWDATNTVEGPFPATTQFTYSYDDWGFDDYTDEQIWVNAGTYSDGTLFSGALPVAATLAGSNGVSTVDFDYNVPDWSGIDFFLTDQVAAPELPCCSANWTGPDYMPYDGLEDDPTDTDGIGVDHIMFLVDAMDDLTDDDLEVLHDDMAIDFDSYAGIAEDGMMADAGLDLSLNNDDHDLCVVAWDKFGQWDFICLAGDGSNPTDDTFGYDNTLPNDVSDPDDSHPNMFIYNSMTVAPASQVLELSGTEDRSGFSTVPFRGFITWYEADDVSYVANASNDVDEDEGPYNMGSFTLPACAADPTYAVPCYPNDASSDGVYNVNANILNQAGGIGATNHDYWVAVDVTAPTQDNTTLPATVDVGDPATYSAPVSDNLHVGCTAFSFDFPTGIYVPFGDNVCNADDDMFDLNFPTDDVAIWTQDYAVTTVEAAPGGVPTGAGAIFTNVRAQHTDLAGNFSPAVQNNFIAGTVEAGTTYDAVGITDYYLDIGGDADLCNGSSAAVADCDTDAGEVYSVDVDIVVEGASGTFANPFASGELYVWLVHDPNDTYLDVAADEVFYLLGTINASSAVVTDDGLVRQYTWTHTINSDDILGRFPGGEDVYIAVGGFKYSKGTVLISDPQADAITVVDAK